MSDIKDVKDNKDQEPKKPMKFTAPKRTAQIQQEIDKANDLEKAIETLKKQRNDVIEKARSVIIQKWKPNLEKYSDLEKKFKEEYAKIQGNLESLQQKYRALVAPLVSKGKTGRSDVGKSQSLWEIKMDAFEAGVLLHKPNRIRSTQENKKQSNAPSLTGDSFFQSTLSDPNILSEMNRDNPNARRINFETKQEAVRRKLRSDEMDEPELSKLRQEIKALKEKLKGAQKELEPYLKEKFKMDTEILEKEKSIRLEFEAQEQKLKKELEGLKHKPAKP